MRRPAKFHVDSAVRFELSRIFGRGGVKRPPPPPVKRGLSLAHKVIRSGKPDTLAAFFQMNLEKRERSTRQDHLYVVPRCKTEFGKRRFSVRGPKIYNSLPSEMNHMRPATFNRELKKLLLNQ